MRSSATRTAIYSLLAGLLLSIPAGAQQGAAKPKLYNTAKQKLQDGKQVFSYTISRLDVDFYCEVAKHYDFVWFEMQHSTMIWADIEKMIAACPHAGAIPMVRMPDEQESSIQHATDIGALGIIMPTVDTPEKALQTAKYARYPPVGRRSAGAGQASAVWGVDGTNYHDTVNDNMLVVLMIETPTGVANAYEIARVPGVDVVILGNNDLSQFSGYKQTDDRYQQLMNDARDAVKKAGKVFGTAAFGYSKGNPVSKDAQFFQNGPSNDGWVPPARAGRGGRGAAAGTPGRGAIKPGQGTAQDKE
jgi:2-keto-3-deoxy-L-rhamnonate aldolase RhmA